MVDDKASVSDDQKQSSSYKKQPMHVSYCNDIDNSRSESMRIKVTLYSMEGIRRHDLESRQSSQSQRVISQKRTTPKSTSKAPTTAIVSLRGQVIKTLVPSAPLAFYETRKAEQSVRGIASWHDYMIDEEKKNMDENQPSTFELSRNMKRQRFHRKARIGQVSQFLPERIDLVVGVARGKDIFPLGVASIVVSGEEEGENLLNIPIKSLLVQNEKMNSKGRQKNRLLFDGDTYWYSLDSNAFLRVGICAIPSHNYIPRTMDTLGGTMLIGKSEENMIIQLNDENSLIAHFKESEQTETTKPFPEGTDVDDSGCYMMFCGALGCFPGPARQLPSLSSDGKIMEAKVFSLRAMSDVSGSTVRWQNRREMQYEA